MNAVELHFHCILICFIQEENGLSDMRLLHMGVLLLHKHLQELLLCLYQLQGLRIHFFSELLSAVRHLLVLDE